MLMTTHQVEKNTVNDFLLQSWAFTNSSAFVAVKELCVVYFSVRNDKLWVEERSYRSPSGQKWRDLQFEMFILQNSAAVDFIVAYRGEPIAACEAKYKESF